MSDRPIVLVTGAAGVVGAAVLKGLADAYRLVGLDKEGASASVPLFAADLTDEASTASALDRVEAEHGRRLASVIHLAAHVDFTGEEHLLYRTLNVEGTRRLLRLLNARFEVEQFVYPSTMLVHAPGHPGSRIDETQPIRPAWAYPRSKADAEAVLAAEHGAIPYVVLRLAGVYDKGRAVPSLAHQIARIFERIPESHLYPGDTRVGQAMLHAEDLADAVRRTVDRRSELAKTDGVALLIGEGEAMSYAELQRAIGLKLYDLPWPTVRPPSALAKLGAAVEAVVAPALPASLGGGRDPFVRPFMVDRASDHYALDARRAEQALGWRPRHSLRATLPAMLEALKRNPEAWYRANRVAPPALWPNPDYLAP